MMNRTWKSVFSVLLAIALLLPMAPAVRAEEAIPTVAATSVTLSLDSGDQLIYFRDDEYNGTITLTATVEPASYDGWIHWNLSDNAPLSIDSGKTDDKFDGITGKAKITLVATNPVGSYNKYPTVSATVKGEANSNNPKSNDFPIHVEPDGLEGDVGFSQKDVSLQVGESVQLSLTAMRYLSKAPLQPDKPKITYTSSKESVATVDKNTGKVTAKAAGSAVITATIDTGTAGTGKIERTVSVSVRSPSSGFTGSATIGTKFSMQDFYDDVRDAFHNAHGSYPDAADRIVFSDLSKTNGTLMTKNDTEVDNDAYTLTQFRDMYLNPTGEGTFKCTAKVISGGRELDVSITITVSAPSVPVLIPIDGSANYTFSRPSAETSGKSGVQLMKEAIGAFGLIEFGSVSSESSSVGALYTSAPVSTQKLVGRGTTVLASAIEELYFTPSRAGTYTIPFTAYRTTSGYGVVCTGELILPVDGSSLDLTFNLSKVEPYTFSEKPNSSTSSLYSQLLNAINSSIGGGSWSGIRFDAASGSSSIGTLHESSSHSRAISSDDFIAKSSLSRLYYVPERSGTYVTTYRIYSSESSTTAITAGKLTIKTSTIPAGAPDVTYTILAKDSVKLQESDFINFFQAENGSRYQLSYVVFNEYDGEGVFYHDKDSFLPGNSADFYTSTYTGTVPSNARYLSRLSFTAPATAGYTAVLFTCYGGTTTDGTSRVTTGKLCIFYTADDVPAVSYNTMGVTSVSLKESDFATAYNATMKTSLSRPSFTVQLLNTPSKGSLYYYYSGTKSMQLTSSNISNYTFSVNQTSGTSVEDVSYMPGRNVSGTDEVLYLATAADGTILYVGTIQFKLSSDLTLNVTNDGSNFQLSDFYNSNDSDPVVYVTFPKPSTGKVYVYSGSRYITVSADTRLYTSSSANGDYPLTSAFYAPKANETGTVSIKCVAHRKSGVTENNTITFTVLSKASSGSFGDVGGVFNWAANSIDFASKLGLVNGTQLNPPLFSPANTMRRSDFVLMLYRLAGSPTVTGALPYTDVTSDKYYYDSAVWAYRNNIMSNVTTNGRYDPEGALTRQDFAQILFNYTAAMGISTANNGSIAAYTDASSVSANTLAGVTWAVANGYITSAAVGQLYIEPTRAATRAEISTLLHRYLTY